MLTVYCENCAVELVEDDVLTQDIYPENNSAYQYKLWHCPVCNIEYSGEIWYALSAQRVDIRKD